MKKINVFGSTGSIGQCTLDIIRAHKKDFSVKGLCAHSNVRLLRRQVEEFRPRFVCLTDEKKAAALKKMLPRGVKLLSGADGLEGFSRIPCDIAVMGIAGVACLKPLLNALQYSRRVALANKESMVCAAGLVKKTARRYGTELIPVDSEINALFQMLEIVPPSCLEKVYLTASGGSLYDFSRRRIKKATVADVLTHPTWKMGKRITVDSATLVNKGFEVVETREFFGLDYSDIEIVIHRDSVAHAFIRGQDGISFCCLYDPDMKRPIAHALYYPERARTGERKALFPSRVRSFSFSRPEYKRFPLLQGVLDAARKGGNALVVFNASDEVAIRYFLSGRITFSALCDSVLHSMAHYRPGPVNSLKDVVYWDGWAREKTKEYIEWKY